MSQSVSGRGAAFSHGFTRKQEAEIGTRLISDAANSTSLEDVLRLIARSRSGVPSSSLAHLSTPRPSKAAPLYRPPDHLSAKSIDHRGYIANTLSSASNSELLDQIAQHFLCCSIDEHAQALDGLRNDNPRIHELLLKGDGDLALDAIRADNMMHSADREKLIEGVRRHMRLWLIRTARKRADDLADFSKMPWGTTLPLMSAFAGFTGYKGTGYVFLASQAAPAKLLQRIIDKARAGLFDGLTEEQTIERLIASGLLSAEPFRPKSVEPLLKKLKGITYQLGRSSAFAGPSWVAPVLDTIGTIAQPLSGFTQRHMKEAGLGKMDLNAYRHGIATSEIITFIAQELHEAGLHLDACVDARLAGRPLPERTSDVPSIKQLACSAIILRAEAEGDRHAIDLHRTGPDHDVLDKNRNSGAGPVRTMRRKLGDPALAAHLRTTLAIDVTPWFRP